jgi:hypothetical protein
MKPKRFDKKLVLNKEILARLGNGEMKVARAGINPWIDNQTTPELCP